MSTACIKFGYFKWPERILNSTHFIWFWRRKILNSLLVRQQSSSLSPSLSFCLSSDHHFQRLFQKAVEGSDCKIKVGQSFCTTSESRRVKHKNRVFPSRQQAAAVPVVWAVARGIRFCSMFLHIEQVKKNTDM